MRNAFILTSCLFATDLALAQQAAVVADLASIAPVTLSKTDLAGLLPNAKVTRIIANGNKHIWTNDSDGTFIVSSDNRATNGHTSTGQGKWHLSDDGRYCVLIEWRGHAEDWCRFVIKTDDGYYTAKSVKVGTEKVYKLEISK